jgi:hypothetical protein
MPLGDMMGDERHRAHAWLTNAIRRTAGHGELGERFVDLALAIANDELTPFDYQVVLTRSRSMRASAALARLFAEEALGADQPPLRRNRLIAGFRALVVSDWMWRDDPAEPDGFHTGLLELDRRIARLVRERDDVAPGLRRLYSPVKYEPAPAAQDWLRELRTACREEHRERSTQVVATSAKTAPVLLVTRPSVHFRGPRIPRRGHQYLLAIINGNEEAPVQIPEGWTKALLESKSGGRKPKKDALSNAKRWLSEYVGTTDLGLIDFSCESVK